MPPKTYKLTQKQDEFIFSEKRFPAYVGGWGCGKSLAAIARAMDFSVETPGNLGLICRMEYTDLRDSTIKDFEKLTGLKVNSSSKEVELSNGSVIMFRHASELATLQNINLGWFWIEQAEELLTEEQWFYLHGRLRRDSKRRSGWITANVNGHNWIYKLWKEKPYSEDYHLIESSTFENKENLPDDFVKSLNGLPENIYRRMVLNDWSCAEGLVYPDFDEKVHVVEPYEIPNEWKETIGLDHGFAHPTAVLFAAMDYDGTMIIYAEHVEKEQLISYHAQKIKEIEPLWNTLDRVADPSCRCRTMQSSGRIYSVFDEYLDHGIGWREARNEWQGGVNRVGELFKNRKIKIFSTCTHLITELKQYKYKPFRPGTMDQPERPIKINDDAVDCLRYIVASRPDAAERPKVVNKELTHSAWDEYYAKQMEKEEMCA